MKAPRCKKCGKPLRDPRSIAAGMGPVCRGARGHGGLRARAGRVPGRKGTRSGVPQAKGAGAWGGERGPRDEARPRVGMRVRVVKPYLKSDQEVYVEKNGIVLRFLRLDPEACVVEFEHTELSCVQRRAAFPLACLAVVEEAVVKEGEPVGRRVRVKAPYMPTDEDAGLVGKAGVIDAVVGENVEGRLLVRVRLDGKDLPKHLREAVFPMECLEILEEGH